MLLFNILLLMIYCCSTLSEAVEFIKPPLLVPQLPKCDNSNGLHLNFSKTGIQRIPKSFLPSGQVTCISLESNSINEIENEAFQEFSNLQYLNLRDNKFLQNSNLLSNVFPALKTLILDGVHFGALNEYRSYNYERLYLHIRLIAPQLERLFLRHNNIISIIMNETSNLKELYLNENNLNQITIQGNRPNLTHLHLANNAISSIDLKYFPNLKEFVLDNNGIISIGNDDCWDSYGSCNSLNFENNIKLEKLSMKKNQVKRISRNTLTSLMSLKYFDLSSNNLVYVSEDEFTQLKKIQTILLDHNALESTPNFSDLQNLEYLLLNDNHIRGIGRSVFRNLPQLKLLKLNNNKVKEIVAGTFDEMPSLQELDLSKNEITTCADGWISMLTSLRTLHLNNNMFDDGENIALNGTYTDLQYINLLSNPFTNLTVQSIMFLPPNAVLDLKDITAMRRY